MIRMERVRFHGRIKSFQTQRISSPCMKYSPFERKLFEKRGEHHLVQVFERGARRELRFGNHIVQSSFVPNVPDVLQLDYTRAMIAAFVFVPNVRRVLHIGLGAGTLPRFIHRHFPDVVQKIVELSPEVIEAAFQFFDLPRSYRMEVIEGDGAEFVRNDRSDYELIFVDAFHAEGASHEMQQSETLQALRKRLSPEGWLVCNAWGSDQINLRRLTYELIKVVPMLFSISVRINSNVIFIGKVGKQTPSPQELMGRAVELSKNIPVEFHHFIPRIKRVKPGVPVIEAPV